MNNPTPLTGHSSATGRIGIDFGRVIVDPASPRGREHTSRERSLLAASEHRALRAPASPAAFEVIRRLVEHYQGKVWLVSKCGPRIEGRTRRWLEFHDFYGNTGVARDHLRFCRKRPHKRHHCAELGITHFVDDRVDVLSHLRGLVPNLYLFGHQRRPRRIPWLLPVLDWRQVEAELLPAESRLRIAPVEMAEGSNSGVDARSASGPGKEGLGQESSRRLGAWGGRRGP